MRKIGLYLSLFLIIILLFFIPMIWNKLVVGFRLDKIEGSNLKYENPAPLCLPTCEEKARALEILKQPFFYLNKGCQAYVFESQDKKYVLKFVRFHKYRIPFWKEMRFLPFLKNYCQKFSAQRKKSFYETMFSYSVAFSLLKEETGTLFFSLGVTGLEGEKTFFFDRLGRKYEIDLGKTVFILQRKGDVLSKSFIRLQKERKDLRETVDSYFKNVLSLYQKGFILNDPNVARNCALLDGRIVQIDIGSFSRRHGSFEWEFFNLTKKFKQFLLKREPSILTYFDEELKRIMEENVGEK